MAAHRHRDLDVCRRSAPDDFDGEHLRSRRRRDRERSATSARLASARAQLVGGARRAQDFERNIRAVSGGGGLITGIPEGAGRTRAGSRSRRRRQHRTERRPRRDRDLSGHRRPAPISPVSSHERRGANRTRRLRGRRMPELPRWKELDQQPSRLHPARRCHRRGRRAAGEVPLPGRDLRRRIFSPTA